MRELIERLRSEAEFLRTIVVRRFMNGEATNQFSTIDTALRLARDRIQEDRDCLFESHVNPATNQVTDSLGLQGLKEYDDVLAQIDAALEMVGRTK